MKAVKTKTKAKQPTLSTPTGNKPPAIPASPPSPHTGPPPPEYLLELALGEPDRRLLEGYIDVIQVLRNEKRFSFREIAVWLKENGVETDHNAVYRAYCNNLPPELVEEFERETALEEQAEQERR